MILTTIREKLTLDQMEVRLHRMEVGTHFKIYGHYATWQLKESTDTHFVIVSDLKKKITIEK